ncbi:MAG: hypothetical protein ACRDY1_15795, partial [Acidimicrobiales bacterium]
PTLFSHLIATKHLGDMMVGYLIGGGLMMAAGVVEVGLGVDAEGKSLEEIATPLSAVDAEEGSGESAQTAGPPDARTRQTGPSPIPRRWVAGVAWAPRPQLSNYPRTNPYLAREVDILVGRLEDGGPQTALELSRSVGARYWGPGRFRTATRSGLASGRIRRVGRSRYAAGGGPATAEGARAGASSPPGR